jgi:hypothetical protein
MRGAGAIALFLSVGGMLLAVWSCSYETTATPICGDTTLPSGQQCILWPSACGCTAGQRCGYDGTAFVCETPGTAGVGSPCVDDSACAMGTLCDGARCRQLCFEALDCGDDDAIACYFIDSPNNSQYAAVCHRDCDPVSPQAPLDPRLETCMADETCGFDLFGYAAAPACERTTMAGARGTACTTDAQCVPKLGCIHASDGGAGTCQPYCWIGSSTCASPSTCQPLDSNNTPISVLGNDMLGACL